MLSDADPLAVGPVADPGIGLLASREDHVHVGVHSIRELGEAELYGDVTLSSGLAISMTQVLQDIQISVVPGAIDHGLLLPASLLDDDHPQYALADKSRPSPWVAETDVPVLTDAKYPNALLLDGSRMIVGNVKFDVDLGIEWQTSDTDTQIRLLWDDSDWRLKLGEWYQNEFEFFSELEVGDIRFSGWRMNTRDAYWYTADEDVYLFIWYVRRVPEAWLTFIYIENGVARISPDIIWFGRQDGILKTSHLDNSYIAIQAIQNGVGPIEVARIFGGAEPDFRISRAGDITVLADKVLNFGDNHILYSPHHHHAPFTIAAGAANVTLDAVPAGFFVSDMHVSKLGAAVDIAPGGGKTVTVTLSNGVSTMTVTITGAAMSGETTTNEFDWDVSAQTETLAYSQTGGGASRNVYISWIEHHITNV